MAEAAAVKAAPKKVVKVQKEFTFAWEATDRKGAKIKGSSVGPSEALAPLGAPEAVELHVHVRPVQAAADDRFGPLGQNGPAHGDVAKPLEVRAAAKSDKKSGTRVTAWADPKYFDSPNLPLGELQRLLRSKAVLLPGVEVTLVNEKTGEQQSGTAGLPPEDDSQRAEYLGGDDGGQ